jgi:hypothetical protein
MIINQRGKNDMKFGILKEFKNTKEYEWLNKSLNSENVVFSNDIKKLKSHQIYSNDINDKKGKKLLKAIWTTSKLDGEDCFVLLDVVKGKYENSKYLKQKLILNQFFQTGEHIHGQVKESDFEDSVYQLGEEIDRPLYFSHRKVIKLSEEQEAILQKDFYSGFYILSGIAGSGKTSVAYLKLKELSKNGHKCLFTTGNSHLADHLKKMFVEENLGENIEFLGYKDLMDSYYSNVSDLEKVGFEEFVNYVGGKKITKSGLSLEMLYSVMQYIAANPDITPGKRQFYQEIKEKDFKSYVELYYKYLENLEKENKIDLSLSTLELKDQNNSFDYIVVDESQDLSPREIENISLLRDRQIGAVMFNVDANQHSNISLPIKYLKSHENTKEIINVLDSSFRIPKDISKLAQGIVDARSFVMQGIPDKDMIKAFSSSNVNQGNVLHIDLKEGQKFFDSTQIAVIVLNAEDKKEAEELLPNITQIFTADEIKGLEYNTVIVYNPYDNFSNILQKHHTISWNKSDIKNNLPKDINSVNHDEKILFNQFFTSVTRAKSNIYILEKHPDSIDKYCFNFKEYLIEDIEQGEIVQEEKQTDRGWINQINVLVANDNMSQAVKAYRKKDFSIEKLKEKGFVDLTYELYLVSVLSDMQDLLKVPEVYLSNKLYRDILKHIDFKIIENDIKLQSIDFCKFAVDINNNNILHVPKGLYEITEYFLGIFNNKLSNIPQHLQTLDICLHVVEKDFENNFVDIPNRHEGMIYTTILNQWYGNSLENFPKDFVNQSLAGVAVEINVNNLYYLSDEFHSFDTYKSALRSYNNSLKDFPKDFVNQQSAIVGARLDANNLQYISNKLKTDATYRSALKSYQDSLKDFPKDLINNELARVAVELNPYNLRYFPYKKLLDKFPIEYITQEIAEVAAALNPYNLKNIYRSDKHFNFSKIYKSTLNSYNNSLAEFPKELVNQNIANIAISLDCYNLEYIPNKLKTYGIYKSVINVCNNSLEDFFTNFPKEEINQKISNAAVSVDAYNLQRLPEYLLNKTTYSYLLKPYNYSLKEFPEELINKDITNSAIELFPKNLKYSDYKSSLKDFPIELITQEIADAAIDLRVQNIDFIPNEFKNYKVYKKAMHLCNGSLERFLQISLKEEMNQKIANAAINLDPYNLEYIPNEFKTYSVYISALKFCNNSLKEFFETFPKERINQKLADAAINLDPYNLNKNLFEAAVKLDKKNLEYIPDKFLTEDIYKLAIPDSFGYMDDVEENMIGHSNNFYEE